MAANILGNLFTRGFVSGAATSVAVYALYSTLIQPSHPVERDTRELESPADEDLQRTLKGSDIFKYGIPDVGSQTRYYMNQALSYNQARKTPNWVAEHITKDCLQGPANRNRANFKMDPNLNVMFSSLNSDYKNSGWSRGHMAPAGDNKYSQKAMDETFYLTNILPQNIDNNMNFWNRLEIYCRDLTATFSDVRVISGPLMQPNVEEEGGKQFVKYEVIGKNLVGAPTHLFKVIAVEQDGKPGVVGVGAFVVPNEKIASTQKLKDYQVPLETLEKAAGVTFLPNLTKSATVDLCSLDACMLKGQDELDLHFIGKRIENATSMSRLEKSWSELAKRNLEPGENLKNLYVEKKRELLSKEEKEG